MQVKLNGQMIHTESKNITQLLEEFSITKQSIAVAVNLDVLKQELWDSYPLKENDNIECLTFMGGG